MDEKKLYTGEFQVKDIGRNIRRKLFEKSVPNTCNISLLKNIFFQNVICVFQISLKYIKLVIPEILFILVLCDFSFYLKIT